MLEVRVYPVGQEYIAVAGTVVAPGVGAGGIGGIHVVPNCVYPQGQVEVVGVVGVVGAVEPFPLTVIVYVVLTHEVFRDLTDTLYFPLGILEGTWKATELPLLESPKMIYLGEDVV